MRDAAVFDGVKASREAGALLRFAGLVLDLDACMLARETGEAIPLTRGEFALLRVFAARPGRVISRDTLLDAVASRPMEPFDRSVDVLIGRLRRKIEPDPKEPRLIVTVPGEGYRFDGLRSSSPQTAKLPDLDPAAKRVAPGPPRLSVVVLPFANLGGDPEQECFADGLTDSLTTDLSRINGAFVIGRGTAFAYKGKIVDAKQIGRELNVRYVLEGSVQRGAKRMRVNGSARNLSCAEADRADRSLNSDSMDNLFSRTCAYSTKAQPPSILGKARFYFDRAVELDPSNVDALVLRAWADLLFVERIGCQRTGAEPVALCRDRLAESAETQARQRGTRIAQWAN